MKLHQFIDHTLLKADTTRTAIERLCSEAQAHQFAAVCVPPYFVAQVANFLDSCPVKVATVIGFPLGYCHTVAKVAEINRAIEEGADEFDVVINLAALKSEDWNLVHSDLDRSITACHLRNKTVKIIIESGLLTRPELERVCRILNELQPHFAKTSTGFNGVGAEIETVQLMRQLLDKDIKIKASGGIRTAADAKAFLEAGAERLGTSASLQIIAE
ncbi:MAG: deoxyribose-phosphate aldolase [Bacteroidetes bacterium]|nr:MAG: deoxyribose-phosphate aldolase [Bacteroidota bacterium]